MLLFRAEEQIDRWCRARDLPRGAMMTPDQCWHLARAWFGDRLQPDWRRFTLDESERVFLEAGLTGTFWNLR